MHAAGWVALGALAGAACGRHALAPAAPSVVPATFAVRMHRARKPGDHGMLSAAVAIRRATITEEGDRIVKREEESRDVDLKAAVSVLQIDTTGEPVDLQLTVESLMVETPAGRRELLAGGRIVTLSRGKERVSYVTSEPLPPGAEKALDDIVSPHASPVTDDEIFGTREPQALGAIWPVNAALAAGELRDLHVQPDDIHGQTRLVGLAQAQGHTCLDLTGEFFVSPVHPPDRDGGDAPGPRSEYEARVTHRGLFPVDPAVPALDTTVTIELDVRVTTPLGPGRETRTTTTYHDEKRRRFTPQP